MPESGAAPRPFDTIDSKELSPEIRELVDAVVDVANRLNHNVLAPEHLLVVGAENGVTEMARAVPSLSAFREALLDSLFDDRDMFRFEKEEAEEDSLYVQPDFEAVVDRMVAGEDCRALLAELMNGTQPRIQKALAYARGTEPDVVPPDTIMLERAMDTGSFASAVDPSASASGSAELDAASADPEARGPLDLPLTVNLGEDAALDPALVGRDGIADQVARILLRFHQPAVLLIGAAGSGKTAFVRGIAKAAADGSLPALSNFHFYKLKLLDLVAQSHRGQDVHNLLDQILTVIASDPTGVLVIDDLHLLVAKQGYPLASDLIDTIKLHISKGKVRALLTVDAGAYEKAFSADAFFSSQITTKTLPVLERATLVEVVRVYQSRLEDHFALTIGNEAIEEAVTSTLIEDGDYAAPGATIRLLDEACAMARSEEAQEVTGDHVRRCASEEFGDQPRFDRQRLRDLEKALTTRVLGQEMAAGAVARRVRLAKLHLDRKPERPDGVFLFMGPSGVGKTELARELARALYDDESRLVRLDMSEYMEPHSVARIIGAPPGYVGYGEEGALTGPVNQLDHCVVLLDEIEKAHPRVLNLFLQVFDDGRLTDSKGRQVSFSDTVVIMTSNIGRELYAIHGERQIGFGGKNGREEEGEQQHPLRDAVQDHLLRVLPSEFVNRIDEIVPFRVLEDDDILRISQRLLDMEVERWRERGKAVDYDDEVPRIIALSGYDPRLGARHVERNLERLIISLISDAAVTDRFVSVEKLSLRTKDGIICLELDGEPFECLHPQQGMTPESVEEG